MRHRQSCLWFCVLVLLTGCGRDPLPGFPRVILWAWESPQNLSFIDPHDAGVAFLAKTLFLGDHQATMRPRLQPLRVPSGTTLIAVVRLESTGHNDLPPSAEIAPVIADLAREPGIRALQIDYDARVSERAFYRQLIGEVKRRLPDQFPLSITALASWCNGDGWIATLPVSDAVPMLFRMGPDRYRPGDRFRVPLCQTAVGVSMDEPVERLPRGRRIYIFHPGPWTQRDYKNALQEVHQWQ
jgi:hypothetical protein